MARDTDVLAQVALWCRKLAVLLRLNVPMVVALEVLAEEFADLCDMSLQVREEVRAGESFSDALSRQRTIFPRFARVVIVAGEQAGDIVGALSQLGELLSEQAQLRVRKTTDLERRLHDSQRAAERPATLAAERALHEAARSGANELHLIPEARGGVVRILASGAWRRAFELPADVFPAVIRRIKGMANIPYWIGEPAMGQFSVNVDDVVWDFAVRAIPVEGTEEGRLEMTVTARSGTDETA